MSPGGARPKIVIGINGDSIISGTQRLPDGFEYWLLKFHTAITKSDDGLIEEAYSRMVKESGINMPETQLLDVNGTRFFAVKRFDRVFNEFRHIHSLAGLVNADFRQPDFDYEKLFRVTKMLTNNNEDLEQIYKQMVFNVLSHNQDDHTKNFSFTTDGDGIWRSSPAYDITFNSSAYGEQSMALMGGGENIPDQVFFELGAVCGINKAYVATIFEQIFEQIFEALSHWNSIASDLEISSHAKKDIQEHLNLLHGHYGHLAS